MIIREFEETDRQELKYVYYETRKQTFFWLDNESLSRSDFDKDTEGEKIWVCEVDHTLVGFIAADVATRFIHHLYILPKYASQGYGSALLSICLDVIGHPAELQCIAENTRALGFYRSQGWLTIARGLSYGNEYYLMKSC